MIDAAERKRKTEEVWTLEIQQQYKQVEREMDVATAKGLYMASYEGKIHPRIVTTLQGLGYQVFDVFDSNGRHTKVTNIYWS